MKTEDEKQSESKEEHDVEGAQSPDLTDGDDAELDGEPSSEEVAEPLSYEELEQQLAETKDQLLRTVAESENVRRRTEKEKSDASKFAITNFARSFLSVADNLNRALESITEGARKKNKDLENLFVGIEMTEKELEAVYEQFNIKAIDALGKPFDHNFHQAMFEVEDEEVPTGTIVEQMQKGYTIHDRLLRPAMVGVAKGGKGKADDQIEKEVSEDKNQEKEQKGYKESSAAAYSKGSNKTEAGDNPSPKIDKKL